MGNSFLADVRKKQKEQERLEKIEKHPMIRKSILRALEPFRTMIAMTSDDLNIRITSKFGSFILCKENRADQANGYGFLSIYPTWQTLFHFERSGGQGGEFTLYFYVSDTTKEFLKENKIDYDILNKATIMRTDPYEHDRIIINKMLPVLNSGLFSRMLALLLDDIENQEQIREERTKKFLAEIEEVKNDPDFVSREWESFLDRSQQAILNGFHVRSVKFSTANPVNEIGGFQQGIFNYILSTPRQAGKTNLSSLFGLYP